MLFTETNVKKKTSEARKSLAARYAKYLEDLSAGKETIKSTGTQPHELIEPYMSMDDGEVDATIEGTVSYCITLLFKSDETFTVD